MALGANRRSIVSMVLGRALALIAIGTVLGGAAAFAGQTLLQKMVFALDAPHPTALLAAATAIVVLTAVAAACPPAIRAASIDPTTALRTE
jgi:ABC-type antimicrobial peptide transport system permease subunit